MANTSDGTGWDEGYPAANDELSNGRVEIIDLRKGTRIRLEKEHIVLAPLSVGGEHLEGSAKVFYGDVATITTRNDPSTTTLASTGDDGRILVDDGSVTAANEGRMWYWAEDAWAPLKVGASNLIALAVGTAAIAADAVDKTKIAADVAGLGLGQNADGSLQVTVDNVTLQIASDTVKVKAEGIDVAQIKHDIDLSTLTEMKMPAKYARFKSGSYSASPTHTVTVSDVGFEPEFLMVVRANTRFRWFAMHDTYDIGAADTATAMSSGGITLTSTGFTVEDAPDDQDSHDPNAAGTYYYLAIG